MLGDIDMSFLLVPVYRTLIYIEYLWDGLSTRWQSRSEIGLWGLIKGFFTNFVESWSLLRIDIEQGFA